MTTTSSKALAFADLERELAVTRRVLERLPADQLTWKPHEKSMPLGNLALHVANLVQWMRDTVEKDELDMETTPPMRQKSESLADILDTFDNNLVGFRAAWARMDDVGLAKAWSLRSGALVLHTQPRATILRLWCINHLVHHRGQLCVYLRVLGRPVPAVYFNSADEPEWKFE